MDHSEPITVYAIQKGWGTVNINPYNYLIWINYKNVLTGKEFKIWIN
jgi:hypothetical protein